MEFRFVTRSQGRQECARPRLVRQWPGGRLRFKSNVDAGVNSYSGYVDLDAHTHMFFWFFEARKNPHTAPITLWLNGGPGSDSMIGLFQGQFATGAAASAG